MSVALTRVAPRTLPFITFPSRRNWNQIGTSLMHPNQTFKPIGRDFIGSTDSMNTLYSIPRWYQQNGTILSSYIISSWKTSSLGPPLLLRPISSSQPLEFWIYRSILISLAYRILMASYFTLQGGTVISSSRGSESPWLATDPLRAYHLLLWLERIRPRWNLLSSVPSSSLSSPRIQMWMWLNSFVPPTGTLSRYVLYPYNGVLQIDLFQRSRESRFPQPRNGFSQRCHSQCESIGTSCI